jgi:hypothetical protein
MSRTIGKRSIDEMIPTMRPPRVTRTR